MTRNQGIYFYSPSNVKFRIRSAVWACRRRRNDRRARERSLFIGDSPVEVGFGLEPGFHRANEAFEAAEAVEFVSVVVVNDRLRDGRAQSGYPLGEPLGTRPP